jgi:hypothetical protein
MEHFIGCDAHKKFSVFVAIDENGQASQSWRVTHDRELYREFLSRLPAHSQIAVEASGSYSWLVDEMERLGHSPRLANPLEAKRRMGLTNKTDKLDAKGLAILLRNGTLPEVWIPPADLRDLAIDSRGRLFVADRSNNRVVIFDQDGKFLAEWKQFGRSSGIYIYKDRVYVSDSESTDAEGYGHDAGVQRGIRIGDAANGKVTGFIPDPAPMGTTSSAEGVAADHEGNIYGAEVGPKDLKKYVPK